VTAFALYRLAVNAGFAAGPAVAGLLAEHSFFRRPGPDRRDGALRGEPDRALARVRVGALSAVLVLGRDYPPRPPKTANGLRGMTSQTTSPPGSTSMRAPPGASLRMRSASARAWSSLSAPARR